MNTGGHFVSEVELKAGCDFKWDGYRVLKVLFLKTLLANNTERHPLLLENKYLFYMFKLFFLNLKIVAKTWPDF